jgi:hypothetical protein
LFIIDSGNGSHCQWNRQSMAAVAMMVFVNDSRGQRRRWWDEDAMTQWHWRQWLLWPMVVAAMVVVVLNCSAAVDAAATIPSSASTAAAKTPFLPPPLTTTFIIHD